MAKNGGQFFVNGPGGMGKSFTWNTLGHSGRGRNLIVLCVASSGIGALILIRGRTSHTMFKIPIQIHEGLFVTLKKALTGQNFVVICRASAYMQSPQ